MAYVPIQYPQYAYSADGPEIFCATPAAKAVLPVTYSAAPAAAPDPSQSVAAWSSRSRAQRVTVIAHPTLGLAISVPLIK